MTPSEKTERLNIFLPKELTKALRAYVPSRQRTAFITQALSRELQRLRLLKAIETTSGAWRMEDHSELPDPDAVGKWVKAGRTERHWPLPADAKQDV